MREIKFRFWSKILNKFVIPKDDIFVGALKDPEMAVMQFTGLKDKNGVDIYEGDIVKNVWHKRKFITGGKQKNHYREVPIVTKQVVTWDNHWSKWDLHKGSSRGEMEVIGNIYENGELL